ncbi:MAG: hypothetical protein AABX50_01640 [Nanoarchaeota archaeon]
MIKITEAGLKRHLEERVIVGFDRESIIKKVRKNTGWVRLGVLQIDSSGIYIRRFKKINTDIRDCAWAELNGSYRLRNGDYIAIRVDDHLRYYLIARLNRS